MKGLAVSSGIGIGKVFIVEDQNIIIEKKDIQNTISEIIRFENALAVCKVQIEEIYIKTLKNIGEKEARIFRAHEMILEDDTFITEIETIIKTEKINVEYALNQTASNYIKLFENIDDEYLRERASDIKDIMTRILNILLCIKTTNFADIMENSVIIAKDLTPSDTAQIDKSKIAAIITETGGKTSHVAIMARTMCIPTVVGIEGIFNRVKENDVVICDGTSGKIIINPGEKQKKYYLNKKENEIKSKKNLKNLIGLQSITKDGFKIELAANIGTPKDIDVALENDTEGIGLFRSEFIYMNRTCLPTEDEQYEAYTEVLSKMKGKSVIIRTMDIGGDKDIPYLSIPKEMNPFMGYRAIRLCLDNKGLFKTQLRAMLRSSVHGNLKIMFPMISTMKELRDAKSIYKETMQELKHERIPFKDDIQIGIMIEIPSAAIISDLLAKEVDFFSIGTNDLIQYTLAVDRMNSKMSYLYSQYHPSMLRLIKNVVKNGHLAGKWVGMCGEAAGDPNLIPVFIGMGFDELSMSASSILATRNIVRNLNKKDMERVADEVLGLETAIEVEKYLNDMFGSSEPDNYLNGMCKKGECKI